MVFLTVLNSLTGESIRKKSRDNSQKFALNGLSPSGIHLMKSELVFGPTLKSTAMKTLVPKLKLLNHI